MPSELPEGQQEETSHRVAAHIGSSKKLVKAEMILTNCEVLVNSTQVPAVGVNLGPQATKCSALRALYQGTTFSRADKGH